VRKEPTEKISIADIPLDFVAARSIADLAADKKAA
jgi:hypothetical protein